MALLLNALPAILSSRSSPPPTCALLSVGAVKSCFCKLSTTRWSSTQELRNALEYDNQHLLQRRRGQAESLTKRHLSTVCATSPNLGAGAGAEKSVALLTIRDTRIVAEQPQDKTLGVHRRAYGRRQAASAAALSILLWSSALVPWLLMPRKLLAEEEAAVKSQVESTEKKDEGILGELLSIFDPNETTKQGKKLPKAYLKSARDVVQTLRASFTEESGSDAKFRRNADSAKEAIRQYITNWRGAKLVDAEQSYQALERALRVLGEFYSKKGPRAVLPEDVRARVLEDLQKADDAL